LCRNVARHVAVMQQIDVRVEWSVGLGAAEKMMECRRAADRPVCTHENEKEVIGCALCVGARTFTFAFTCSAQASHALHGAICDVTVWLSW